MSSDLHIHLAAQFAQDRIAGYEQRSRRSQPTKRSPRRWFARGSRSALAGGPQPSAPALVADGRAANV